MGLAVVSIAIIPLSVLASTVLDRSLRRRSQFWLRLAAFVLAVCLPDLVVVVGSALGLLRDDLLAPMLLSLFVGMVVVAMAPVFLFYGHDVDPGQSDEGDGGPGPGEDPPPPAPPLGGLPLLDAKQSRRRLRGPRPALTGAGSRRRHYLPHRPPSRRPNRVPR